MDLDPLLAKQLSRLGLSVDSPPDAVGWRKFLERISSHYRHVDEDRRLLTRSLELSSQEMQELQNRLTEERDRLRKLIAAISQGLSGFRDAVELLPGYSEADAGRVSHILGTAKSQLADRLAALVGAGAALPANSEAQNVQEEFVFLAEQLAELLSDTAQSAGLQRDLEIARTVQHMLVPSDDVIVRESLKLVGFFRPAAHCGGDWWSVYDLADNKVLTVIGDVTGHGVAPAIITGAAKASCDVARMMYKDRLTCSELLSTMNRCIYAAARQQLFMTCTASIFDPEARTLTIANAGHNFPYLVRRKEDKSKLHHLVSHGNPLGAAPDSQYKSTVVELAEGDIILWYTDGVTECENEESQQFGEKRLRRILTKLASSEPSRVRDGIIHTVSSFCGTRVPEDDMTMVVACVGS